MSEREARLCGFAPGTTCPFRIALICALIMLSAACAGIVKKEPESLTPSASANAAVPQAAPTQGQPSRETGIAAWRGKELQGKNTASGETFDMYGLSAAHRTLPLGTIIRVTNLDNFKSVKVKINDRGPFVKSWILELSYGAAKELGFVDKGTARVKIETVETVRDSARYTVQAASYTEAENARMLKDRLSAKFEMIFIVPLETNTARYYLVRVGSYQSEERAELVARKLTLEGLEPVVLRKDNR